MLTKLQFQTLFGFKPKRRLTSKAGKKVAKKSASKTGKKVAKKSNKVGTRVIKGVKRTVYKGKNGGKFYKKSNGRKVYFGPAMAVARSLGVEGPVAIIGAKAIEGAGYTLGYKAANIGSSMLKKAYKKNKKDSAMGRKKIVAGKKRTVYKSVNGAKYYKSAKGNKVYFGNKGGKNSEHRTTYDDLKKKYGKTDAQAKHNAEHHPDIEYTIAGKKRTERNPRAFFGKKRRSAKGNKVYFGNAQIKSSINDLRELVMRNEAGVQRLFDRSRVANDLANEQQKHTHTIKFGKKRKSSKKNTSFGNHGYQDLNAMMGPAPVMFASHSPVF